MSWSLIIYENLCNVNKSKIKNYKKGSELHEHHIIPKHMGGLDSQDNFTYLTIRQHIIAHYLLFRIHRKIDDLRAMHLLGARLSSRQRKLIGDYCFANKIGFFDEKYDNIRNLWRNNGWVKQQEDCNNSGIKNFYYWTTADGIKERASMGGEASYQKNTKFIEQQCSFNDREKAISAARKSAKIPITNGSITRKLKTIEDVNEFLSKNLGWRKGTHHISKNKGVKTNKVSSKARRVTDGETLFDSLLIAAQKYNVSQATIINWCESPRKPNWAYV